MLRRPKATIERRGIRYSTVRYQHPTAADPGRRAKSQQQPNHSKRAGSSASHPSRGPAAIRLCKQGEIESGVSFCLLVRICRCRSHAPFFTYALLPRRSGSPSIFPFMGGARHLALASPKSTRGELSLTAVPHKRADQQHQGSPTCPPAHTRPVSQPSQPSQPNDQKPKQ